MASTPAAAAVPNHNNNAAATPATTPVNMIGASGFSSYNPISTLARQYSNWNNANAAADDDDNTNNSNNAELELFVQLNAACLIPGGVQGLAQAYKNKQSASDTTANASINAMNASMSSLSVEEPLAETSDPFAFLKSEESPPAALLSDPNTTTNAAPDRNPNKPTKKKIGNFLKKMAQTTTVRLERNLHSLAVRADQGRSRDLLVVGLYRASARASAQEEMGGFTESQALPEDPTQPLSFAIPLVVPSASSSTSSSSSSSSSIAQVTLKVWIRSGAALLGKAAKNHLVGTAQLNVPQLVQQLQSSSSSQTAGIAVPLQSAALAGGQVQILARGLHRPAPLGRPGWSLADPHPQAYQNKSLHWPPLYQSYAKTTTTAATSMPTPATILATERTTESALVVPVATQWAHIVGRSVQQSIAHWNSVRDAVLYQRHDAAFGATYVDVNVGIGVLHILANPTNHHANNTMPVQTLGWQRPDSIFETPLMAPGPATASQTLPTEFRPAHYCRFYPKACDNANAVLPALRQQQATDGAKDKNLWLGNLRYAVTWDTGNSSTASLATGQTAASPAASPEVWQTIIPLEPILHRAPNAASVTAYPVRNVQTGQQMGTITLSLTAQWVATAMQQQQQQQSINTSKAPPPVVHTSRGGLVSLVGLDPCLDGVQPGLDFDVQSAPANSSNAPVVDPHQQRRRDQLATMGHLVGHAYVEHHLQQRLTDGLVVQERAHQYQAALTQAVDRQTRIASHEDKQPRPFRPSSSRNELVLSGLPFNCHTASWELSVAAGDDNSGNSPSGALFHNITCGAPADHARGFGSVFPPAPSGGKKKDEAAILAAQMGLNSPIPGVSGGLRRLEAKRLELAKHVYDLQTTLTLQVANYFVAARQSSGGGDGQAVNHVPGHHAELQALRWQVFEAVQSLHHVTWHCAMRRANCFSQALGLAITSYLASVSDAQKAPQWAASWARHGYLVSFEGLLTSAGKELGMIEDASVSIEMLSKATVAWTAVANEQEASPPNATPIPHSPYLRWLTITPTGEGSRTEYRVQIGVLKSFYDQRIPAALQNGTQVRFYPLLFEVGVDIHQWGAHKGSQVMQNRSKGNAAGGSGSQRNFASSDDKDASLPSSGSILDESDDEDDNGDGSGGIADEDVLVQLNYTAFQKMNSYAFSILPVDATARNRTTHPQLETLYQHILSSAGKITHAILDEAATLAQQLGGGGLVFCKSGKDRTAMHITYKQAQFASRFVRQLQPKEGGDAAPDTPMQGSEEFLADAQLMRIHGTRLPICEKNVGEAKYAFNALQIKFMPASLKPPPSTVAGFLKGGKVFTGGAIES